MIVAAEIKKIQSSSVPLRLYFWLGMLLDDGAGVGGLMLYRLSVELRLRLCVAHWLRRVASLLWLRVALRLLRVALWLLRVVDNGLTVAGGGRKLLRLLRRRRRVLRLIAPVVHAGGDARRDAASRNEYPQDERENDGRDNGFRLLLAFAILVTARVVAALVVLSLQPPLPLSQLELQLVVQACLSHPLMHLSPSSSNSHSSAVGEFSKKSVGAGAGASVLVGAGAGALVLPVAASASPRRRRRDAPPPQPPRAMPGYQKSIAPPPGIEA